MAKSKIYIIEDGDRPVGFMGVDTGRADVLLPESFFEPHTHSVKEFEPAIRQRGIGIDLETLAGSESL